MPTVRDLRRAFNGGEVTPEFFGRIDDQKFQTGLALCRNFVVTPHGPVFNRAGTLFVRAVKNSAKRVKLIPFAYSATQTMVLEFGDQYIRFHTMGATLLNGGVPYEVATPYLEADLFDIHFVQSADVLTLVHPNYAPRELRRLGATNWTLTTIAFASSLAAPTGVTATPTVPSGATGLTTQSYKVTALGADVLDESLASAAASCSNNLNAVGAFNTVTWSAVAGASRYNVYKLDNGLYGFIGQAAGTSFVDDNITADVSITPPEASDPFVGDGNYPAATSYFEQRRAFAGTLNQPQKLWMTRSGTESNLTYSIPSRDDDALEFRVAARENNTIRHIVPLTDMILLTSSAEWRVFSVSGALTPSTLIVKPQSYIGASNTQPVIVNNNLLFEAARGGHLRELAYSTEGGGYLTGDLSLRAPHLFDELQIVDMAYAKSPQPVVWCVSSNGKLLGLTYVPEQNVLAWHQHDTLGLFESVAVVAEGAEDALYVVAKRSIDGADVRYVERMAYRPRGFADPADAFFVDAGVQYNGAPVTTITDGLDHLEGATVAILGDGAVRPPQVVTGGVIVLDQPASKLSIGLPITADLQTLPLAFEAGALGQGRQKNVNKVWLRVVSSAGIFAGPTFGKLTEFKNRTTEPYGSPPALRTEEVGIMVSPTWDDGGQICVRQSDPLPLTLVSMTLETSVGG